MIISNGYLLHLVLLGGLAQQSKHATGKDDDDDDDHHHLHLDICWIQSIIMIINHVL